MLGRGRGTLAIDVAIEVDVNVGLMYDSEEQNGWLNEGAGEGS